MALKDTMQTLSKLLQEVSGDLVKAEKGNKAASQRVRTGTIALEKVAKKYRKESVKANKGKKGKTATKKKTAAKKKVAVKSKAAPKKKTTAKRKAAPKGKATKKKTATRRRR